MKLVSSIFKEDPIHKELKKMGLLTDALSEQVIANCCEFFLKKTKEGEEEHFLKVAIKQLEEKTAYTRKLKVMSCLVEISKLSKYDICDIVLSKKIKTFSKATKHKHNELEPKPQKLEQFIHEELLIPIYNYLMKLATNEELYHTCKQGQIPYDDVFRRGTKIRFIWIFKLYNIISIIVPIIESMIKAFKYNPDSLFFRENISYLYNDLTIMNNFIVKALEEASMDNFMLMPYFDMLQFYESLKEQVQVGKHVRQLYESIRKFTKDVKEPLRVSLKQEEIEEIELQALRVKLISNSLKNPKKDHKRLQTQYQQKTETAEKRKNIITQPNNLSEIKQDFMDKWGHLE